MIQPLKVPKNNWFLYWLDLDEPIPSATGWFLPTLVIICDRLGTPVVPPEVLEELDQRKGRLKGLPAQLIQVSDPLDVQHGALL